LRTLRCGAIVSLRPRATAAARRITMMMPRPKPGDLLGLVDVDKGIVSREIFVNEEIYRQEQERMFARAWLFVGHESQITRPGDYLVSSMGEESVILCRDRAGRIHVFLNSCRHRGMKVCRYDEGNTVEFTCPYHGWSYATDGALVGVPFAKDAYGEHLDRSRWGLVEVAQLESYKGTVWATWDPSAPSFLEYLGGYKLYLDLLLDAWDGREGGTEVIGGIHKSSTCAWRRSHGIVVGGVDSGSRPARGARRCPIAMRRTRGARAGARRCWKSCSCRWPSWGMCCSMTSCQPC